MMKEQRRIFQYTHRAQLHHHLLWPGRTFDLRHFKQTASCSLDPVGAVLLRPEPTYTLPKSSEDVTLLAQSQIQNSQSSFTYIITLFYATATL